MDYSSPSNETLPSGNSPWTTGMLRQQKTNWNLGSDVGLLCHLQQFSETISSSVNKTQEAMDIFNGQMNQMSVVIDNVTNATLALANTQFIESRVYDDESERNLAEKLRQLQSEEKTESRLPETISESILQCLKVMDEKYERLEVITSSDSEEETQSPAPSVLLKPKNFYQSRALPFVIGTSEWKASNKIGLESSSSESEILEEDEEYSQTDEDEKLMHFSTAHRKPVARSRSPTSTCSFDSSRYNEESNNTDELCSQTEKIRTRSQDTLNSTSEIGTIDNEISKNEPKKDIPNFAEELSQRLGQFFPSHEIKKKKSDYDGASIDRSESNLFLSDNENIDALRSEPVNLFSTDINCFEDKVSNSLKKIETMKRFPNVISPDFDIPPPMTAIKKNVDSSIDRLFDDDSDDSDDIFSPRNYRKSSISSYNQSKIFHINDEESRNVEKSTSHDKAMSSAPDADGNIIKSTKDTEDDIKLFSSPHRTTSKLSEDVTSGLPRPTGISVNISDNFLSSTNNMIFNRDKNPLSNPFEKETNAPNEKNIKPSTSADSMGIVGDDASADRVVVAENTIDNNRFPVQPESSNTTFRSGLGRRESKMNPTILQSEDAIKTNKNIDPHQSEEKTEISSSKKYQEDLFDSDDDFCPPRLSENSNKAQSKIPSLFDDSDSGDDLFSNTSYYTPSSRKDGDQHAVVQSGKKSMLVQSRYPFDDFDHDFVNTIDPDIDIFTSESINSSQNIQKQNIMQNIPDDEPTDQKESSKITSGISSNKSFLSKSTLSFDDDNQDLFGSKVQDETKKMEDANKGEQVGASDLSIVNMKHDEKLIANNSHSQNLDNVHSDNPSSEHESNERELISDSSSETLIEKLKKTIINGPGVIEVKSSGGVEKFGRKNPATLSKINLPAVGDTDETNVLHNHAISPKIADLMGRMGDLKILSPSDAPLRSVTSGVKSDSGVDMEDKGSNNVPKPSRSPKKETRGEDIFASVDIMSELKIETAVSFDDPVLVDTLIIPSKNRAKIPTKRKPQTRHARQSALRHSGIGFDNIDTIVSSEISETLDRLTSLDHTETSVTSSSSINKDKTDISSETESSISTANETLLSPTTDEEDLFDVPRDLLGNLHKDNNFSGSAPILPPVEVLFEEEYLDFSKEIENHGQTKISKEKSQNLLGGSSRLLISDKNLPLPDNKLNNVTNNDNDPLYFEVAAEKRKNSNIAEVDLFAEDDSTSLSSGPFCGEITKKPRMATKSLFDDEDSDDENDENNLFCSARTKRVDCKNSEAPKLFENISTASKVHEKSITREDVETDDIEEVFSKTKKDIPGIEARRKPNLKEIFGHSSSVEDDIFSSSQQQSKDSEIFSNDRGNNGADKLIAKNSPLKDGNQSSHSVRKSVTRDLRKEAERIIEDPLSMFQDD